VKRAQTRGVLLTEEDKAAAAAAANLPGPSKFAGVSWDKSARKSKWRAEINHDGKSQRLGSFHDEREAALTVDTAARRLRGEDAHGGRSGTQWLRLNFPTDGEVKSAKDRGALLTEEDKAVATAASGATRTVGVCGRELVQERLQVDGSDQPRWEEAAPGLLRRRARGSASRRCGGAATAWR
jgi:hypothetical protein